MKLLITGGTGFIGQHLVAALLKQNHQITVLSRQPDTLKKRYRERVRSMTSLDEWQADDTYHAVINLAGAPIVDRRWTDHQKQLIWDSRILLTEKLIERMSAANRTPGILISGSAIGYYGDTGDLAVDEDSPNGSDFGARMCHAWESTAFNAQSLGVRTCIIRTGLVLDQAGGILKKMIPPFRFFLGSRLGNGQQWMSWIHINDQVGAMLALLNHVDAEGIYNLTAPEPVTNATLTQTLATSLHRPSFLTIPDWLIKAALGEASHLLLGGQKVFPSRLQALHYVYQYPHLIGALNNLLKPP